VNLLDLIILLYLIPFLILGYRDGLLKKSFAVLGSLIAFIMATKAMANVSGMIYNGYHLRKEMSNIIAFTIVLIVIVVLENLMYHWIHKTAVQDRPKLWSRIGGAFLGGLQGLVAASLMPVFLYIASLPPQKMKQESILYRPFFVIAPAVFDYCTSWVPESRAFIASLEEQFGHISNPD